MSAGGPHLASWLCLACGDVSPPGEYRACPACGDKGVPADLSDMLTLKITRHELRILMIWAERWGAAAKNEQQQDQMRRVVYGIADRLELQNPASGPLTLAGEISELKSAYPGAETTFPEPPE